MAGTVLDTMFVDIISRGVVDAGKAIRGILQETEKATAANKRLRDSIQEVGNAGRGIAGTLGRGGGGFGNVQTVGPKQLGAGSIAEAGANLKRLATPAGAGEGGGFTKELMGWAKSAGSALASITIAAAPLLLMLRQGLQGTVELERFNQAVGAVAREMANLIGPPMRMIADVILQGVSIFRQLGPAGQQLLGFVTGFGLLSTVLSDPALRGALNDLGAAFGDLMIASKPLIAQLANLGIAVVKIGIIEPLKMFAQVLTVAARGLSVFAENVVKGMQMFGLGFTMKDTGKRQELSLNQTGTEDAQASFARIQEAVLKAGMPAVESEDVKQTNYLEQIKTGIDDMGKNLAEFLKLVAFKPNEAGASPPGQFAAGAIDSSFGIGGMAASYLFKKLRK